MEYYYTSKENVSGSELSIVDEEAHHLKNVLRKQPGNEIWVTDGERNVYKTKISVIENERILCGIQEKFYDLNEPVIKVHLYPALLKNPSRFEFIIEKCVEIGINEITPIITGHVVNKATNKQERWKSIALAAVKQSQRCYLPKINKPIPFNESIVKCKDKFGLLAHEKSDKPFDLKFKEQPDISLFIGPEGGFSDDEINMGIQFGIINFNLGNRKLRSETAAIAGLCKLL